MKSDLLSRFSVGFYGIACVFIFCGSVKGYSLSSNDLVNLTRVTRQNKQCNGFKCQTTDDCINGDKRCDGVVDCKDGSDELDDCKQAVTCPGYLFTCDYGACIDDNKKCDGQKDCRDNSDENNCINSGVNKVSSNCKSDQFECKSGQCISLDDKCSGVPECEDHSDETKEACFNMYCPGYTFKCAYGACANGYAYCNGVKDCVDNSDEENCEPKVDPTPPTPVTPSNPNLPHVPSADDCKLPEHPQFGNWAVVGGSNRKPNDLVSKDTFLKFECSEGYKLVPESQYAACLGKDKWSIPSWPACMKKCTPIYSTKTTHIKCVSTKNIEIKCDEAINGTSATFTCEPYYEPADQRKNTRFCWEGLWNLPPPICQPVCGEKKVSAQPLIVNGTEVERGSYPWVTALYHRSSENNYTNVCAGSILTQRVILTAAHCVTDGMNRNIIIPKENIMIGVGKYYNQYKHPDDREAQYSALDKIIVHPFYKGDSQRYSSDIALLITKDELLLSKVVQPVCYQDLPNINLHSGLVGVVSGWGYTVAGDHPSDILLEIDVPYKREEECYQELPSDWADKYYTPDKMCAGHYNKSIAVCRGDSGGGLVYKNNRDSRFYVHGIVSVSHTSQGVCDIQVSALYTKVVKHFDWLEKIVSQYNVS